MDVDQRSRRKCREAAEASRNPDGFVAVVRQEDHSRRMTPQAGDEVVHRLSRKGPPIPHLVHCIGRRHGKDVRLVLWLFEVGLDNVDERLHNKFK